MSIFRRRKIKAIEDPAEATFNRMMELVKNLSLKDYNKLKKAMDQAYKAYQIVKGLDPDEVDNSEFILTKDKEEN